VANNSSEPVQPVAAVKGRVGLIAALLICSIIPLSSAIFILSVSGVNLEFSGRFLISYFLVYILVLLVIVFLCFAFRPLRRSKIGNPKGFNKLATVLLQVPLMGLNFMLVTNIQSAIQREAQERTYGKMTSLATHLEEYDTDYLHYPISHDLNELKSFLKMKDQRFLKSWNDGWDRPLHYESVANGKGYYLYSLGRDGKMEVKSAADYPACDTEYFEDDFVIKDGAFIRRPQGKQKMNWFGFRKHICEPEKK
jgi:hypothetical protein